MTMMHALLTAIAGALLISIGYGLGQKNCPILEPTPAPVVRFDSCEVTYGPVPTPREGWEAWGVVCPEGVEP